jgi:Fe2+ or Zn2+ uptake regulation protein
VRPDLHESVASRLVGRAGRYTRPRRDLIETLAAAGQPMTVEEIHDRSPQLPLSSVYRNLAVFEDSGVVHRLVGNGGFARFELAEALSGHHHHFLCISCGAMTDVELPQPLERELDRVMTRLGHAEGFVIDSHQLDILGRCRACAAVS